VFFILPFLESTQYRVTRVWRDDDTEGVPNRSPWRAEGVPIPTGAIIFVHRRRLDHRYDLNDMNAS